MTNIDPNMDIAPEEVFFFSSGTEDILPTNLLGWMFMIGFFLFFGYVFWRAWKEQVNGKD
jgi:hypothetical protein